MAPEKISAVDEKVEEGQLDYENNLKQFDVLVEEVIFLLGKAPLESEYSFTDYESEKSGTVVFAEGHWVISIDNCDVEFSMNEYGTHISLGAWKTVLTNSRLVTATEKGTKFVFESINNLKVFADCDDGLRVERPFNLSTIQEDFRRVFSRAAFTEEPFQVVPQTEIIPFAEVNVKLELMIERLAFMKAAIEEEETIEEN